MVLDNKDCCKGLRSATPKTDSAKSVKHFQLCHFNSRSMLNKMSEIQLLVANESFDTVCVVETWLKPYIPSTAVSLPGYNIFRHDRTYSRGGGICVYVRDSIKVKIVETSNPLSKLEYIIVELLSHGKLLVGSFYIPPQISGSLETLNELDVIIQKFSSIYQHIIFSGDFNVNVLSASSASNKFKQILDDQCMSIINDSVPTHFTNSISSLLDIVLTNKMSNVSKFNQISIPGISDHELLSCTFTFPTIKHKNKIDFEFRDYNNFNFNSFEAQYYLLDWSSILYTPDINKKLDIFNMFVCLLFEKSIPIRKITKHHGDPPWFSNSISHAITDRDLAYKIWLSRKDESSFNDFKRLRNNATKLIRTAKNNYLRTKVNPNLSGKQVWRNIREMGIGKDSNSTAIPFSPEDFGTYFSNIQTSNVSPSDDHISLKTEGFSFDVFCEDDLIIAFSKISSNSIGQDNIPIKFIRTILLYILPYLLHIFNFIVTSSTFPECWKQGRIIPIPKINHPKTLNDYRPITILPVLSKIFESLIHNQICTYIDSTNRISMFQSGFRPRHSTTTALLNVVDDIRRHIDSKSVVVLVLLDFSKAFDSINHGILIDKILNEFNFSSCAAKLVQSYLENRSQVVNVNNSFSSSSSINKGVPQGSVLGPLLFSLYINSVQERITNSFHLYADDLQVYSEGRLDELGSIVESINADMARIFQWASKHELALNANKSQAIAISNRDIETRLLDPVILNNSVVPYVEVVKNLGLYINKKLSWDNHIGKVSQKVFSILKSFWSLTDFADWKFRLRMFKAFILPHFLYADVVLYGLSESNRSRINRMFNACVRYVFRLKKFDHVSQYSNRLLNVDFKNYLDFRTCLFIYKLIKYKAPLYLYNKISFLSSRRTSKLSIPISRINLFNKSLFVKGFVLWNSLPSDIRSIESEAKFRKICFLYFSSVN